MKIQDESIGMYVGLNDAGKIVQYFADADNLCNNADADVVSIGLVDATVTNYDEVFSTTKNKELNTRYSADDENRNKYDAWLEAQRGNGYDAWLRTQRGKGYAAWLKAQQGAK